MSTEQQPGDAKAAQIGILERNMNPTTIDFLRSHIQELRKRSKANNQPITRLDEEIEAFLLEKLPEDWRPLLPQMKPVLYNATPLSSHIVRLNRNSAGITIRLIKGNAYDRNRLFASLEKQSTHNPQEEAIKAALEQWPPKAKRTKREKVLLRGVNTEQWSQEFTLVGESYSGYKVGMIPLAVWQVRVSAFFATPTKSVLPRVRIPEVRVEILESAGALDEAIGDALVEAMQSLAISACGNVAYGYIYSNPMGRFGDEHVEIPMSLQVCFAPGMEDLATKLIEDYCRQPQSFQDAIDMCEWTDNGIDLVRLESRIGPDEAQPMPRPKRDAPQRTPNQPKPGETFLLFEFQFNSVMLAKNGMVYSTHSMQRAAELEDIYGKTPKALVEAAMVPMDEICKMNSYAEVESVLDDYAEASGIDFDDLKSAVYLQYTSLPASNVQPTVFVLMDLATKAQEVRLAHKGDLSIVTFLEAATSDSKVIGVKPSKLKVAKTLLAAHTEVASWAAQHGVVIEHPVSGFDAGSTQIRLWNKAAEDIFHANAPPWWGKPTNRTLDMFKQDIQKVCDLLASDKQKGEPMSDILVMYLPDSMFFGRNDKYKAWRNEQTRNNN